MPHPAPRSPAQAPARNARPNEGMLSHAAPRSPAQAPARNALPNEGILPHAAPRSPAQAPADRSGSKMLQETLRKMRGHVAASRAPFYSSSSCTCSRARAHTHTHAARTAHGRHHTDTVPRGLACARARAPHEARAALLRGVEPAARAQGLTYSSDL